AIDLEVHTAQSVRDIQVPVEHLNATRVNTEDKRPARHRPRIGFRIILPRQLAVAFVPRVVANGVELCRNGAHLREDFVEGAKFVDVVERDTLIPHVVVTEVNHDRVGARANDRTETAVSEQGTREEGWARFVVGDWVRCGKGDGIEGDGLRGAT